MRHHLIIVVAGAALFALANFSSLQAQGQGRGRGQAAAPARPAPRWPDGRPNFGPLPGELGVWLPGNARFAEPEDGGRGARGGNAAAFAAFNAPVRSEEHTSELQSRQYLVCRLLLEKKKKTI